MAATANIPAGEFIATITDATHFTLTTGTGVTAGTPSMTIGSPAIGGYSNTYTGPTVVNQGTLTVSGTLGSTQVPGDLIINGNTSTTNTTVTQTVAGTIAATSNVTINGNGTLTLAGNNTLNTLTFNDNGGAVNPAVNGSAAGNTLVLNGTTNWITSTNDNYAFTPTIGVSNLLLELNGLNRTVTTTGQSPIDLIISGVIQNVLGGTASPAGLIKAGNGSLVLSAANTFNGGVELVNGTLILNNAAALGTTAGTFTIGDPTTANTVPLTIMAGSAAVTTNAIPVVVNRDFTFGGAVAASNLNLAGTVNLGSANRTITVAAPNVTATLSGLISSASTGGFTKAGPGILKISAANTNANMNGAPIAVSAGLLQDGIANALPNSSPLTVGTGAAYDVNGFAQALQQIAGGGLITNGTSTAVTLAVGGISATDIATTPASNSTFNGIITNNTGALTLAKTGLGSLTLTGLNTYTGPTNVVAGSLIIGANNTLPIANKVVVGTAGDASGATLDLSNFSQTVASVTMSSTTGTDAIIIGSGQTLTVNGADGTTTAVNGNSINNVFRVGGNVSSTAAITTSATVSGAGTLTINNAAANFALDNTLTTAGTSNAVTNLDMSGLANFNATVATFAVGQGNGAAGNLTLAQNNVITASNLTVGNFNTQSNPPTVSSSLILGQSNVINAATVNIGSQKEAGTVAFNTGLTSPTLTIRGTAGGVTRAAVNIGVNNVGTASTPVSSVLLTAGAAAATGASTRSSAP
ncbi:MAG: autotransporter-associated beta strand repeat-containing protein [Chthoniobacter sp.]